MVQKLEQPKADSTEKRRGRPRAYNPDQALQKATLAFWRQGYSGTSLDDLADATGMNRPSIYAAFGNKRSLYLDALKTYWELGYAAMREELAYDKPLAEALMQVYDRALSIYFPPRGQPLGCFAIGTAVTEAAEDADIRTALLTGLRALDDFFEARIRAAKKSAELSSRADATALAMLASATLHTIAIRARAGAKRSDLEKLARQAVGVICSA
jgi:TetR/AcrR family transcriptional regulator, copper-responsive repressor